MDFLPQVSPENLDEGNLQCWNLAMHKNSREVKLNLETHINLERRENVEYHETTPCYLPVWISLWILIRTHWTTILEKIKENENNPYIGSVYSWRPPQCKPSVWNLIQPRSLCICQFLVLHRFFKATGLFPEQTLPRGKVSPFEQGVFKNALHTTQSLNHVCAVVVQVPKFAIMSLMCPPEGILLQNLQRQ